MQGGGGALVSCRNRGYTPVFFNVNGDVPENGDIPDSR